MDTARILVVDDEDSIRSFLVRVLQREGYDVHAAHDGDEALERLETVHYDLILSDIKMQHMDGVTLLKEAKSRHPDVAFILLTGHATVPSAIEALRQGAYDYLLKPVKNEDIIAAVSDGLARRTRSQRRDQLEQIAGQMLDVMQGQPAQAAQPTITQVQLEGLALDTEAYTASLHDQKLELTPTEFRLLTELSHSPGAAMDYVSLVESACGYTCSRQEAREIIGAHVLNLRNKLNVEAGEPFYVESVRGVGYRLLPPES